MVEKPTIGFIGQGFIGKNYANDFERRGYEPVRYARSEVYSQNKEKISSSDIVFVAVPTPTTEKGFDDSIVRSVVALVGEGNIAVIKSTVLPGTTESIQKQYPNKIILHSPEFLAEATASHNASNPERNIVGVPERSGKYEEAAKKVLAVLPEAPFNLICTSRESEIIKYAGNAFLYLKVIFANIMHDLAEKEGADWQVIQGAIAADPRIGGSHLRVKHSSGHEGAKEGRGAGGHCFIKDFAALRTLYAECLPDDKKGLNVLKALECKNNDLLVSSRKDSDLLEGVYGKNAMSPCDFSS
ncbi:hypothetical protein A2673_00170 [Candidatus Kaiserbacteria bacterium RIFCSPHIGHO2_01_FULL_50_13]|uniref:UDP-glucose/GDP-mannose dehydrogenase dimerisation domain-containing protein n=1 Tax=Candidatus Kaiserbacteria bacterium RIFCSPLOWO2_01_FULL_50_24 TaxID=1798507 RepID=A0A1F6EIY0_9BACT|nr:MAG: hypothetical protein A2673_00170 [Candidatus Kaiserbacteria bacterium RIFCSPHIGHO2_01_FULL_50_13]OGG73599.1 MAG: hypothetical protein A3A34_02905 [Candidatus Kaiserbacteria bacterium RIFCSPLOWO2_01_FULL_50_24]OGG81262.1 MAG: hypothetical protein A3H74_03765 [Candidatus Kaiserbacteria bacterium RIFCSPLOWO2_02_FULL_51_13]